LKKPIGRQPPHRPPTLFHDVNGRTATNHTNHTNKKCQAPRSKNRVALPRARHRPGREATNKPRHPRSTPGDSRATPSTPSFLSQPSLLLWSHFFESVKQFAARLFQIGKTKTP